MKTFLTVSLLIGLFMIGIQIRESIIADYHYEKSYAQLWELADKSSTIPAKQDYIKQFVAALKEGKAHGDFADNNAVFLKTPNNSFDSNLKALESLSLRLTEIQNMNPSSFEYNTAIQQITAQEQGEAHQMLSEFQGCYNLNSYSLVWGWIGGTYLVISLLFLLIGGGGWLGKIMDI